MVMVVSQCKINVHDTTERLSLFGFLSCCLLFIGLFALFDMIVRLLDCTHAGVAPASKPESIAPRTRRI